MIIKSKKGLIDQFDKVVKMLSILGIIVAVFIIVALISPPIVDSVTRISDALVDTSSSNPDVQTAINITVPPFAAAVSNLQWIGYALLIFPFLSFLVLAYFVRIYPAVVIFWIIGIMVLIIVSIFFSSGYVNTIGNQELYSNFQTNDFILSNLPWIMTVMGFFGGTILFILIPRDQDLISEAGI